MRRVTLRSVVAFIALSSAAQTNEPKLKLSNQPLTAEHIAIYRAVLQNYTKGDDTPLNLANRTAPLRTNGHFLAEDCVKSAKVASDPAASQVVHLLDRAVALSPRMVLVDPNRQGAKVQENDPDKVIKSTVDKGAKATHKQVVDAVDQAVRGGLFTLSEIAFDQRHHVAVVSYSFYCGSLCGQGSTMVLEKTQGKWKITRRCGGWVS